MKNDGFSKNLVSKFTSEQLFYPMMFSKYFKESRSNFFYFFFFYTFFQAVSPLFTVNFKHCEIEITKGIPVPHYKPLRPTLNIAIGNLFAERSVILKLTA